jgi:glutathione S-transferase
MSLEFVDVATARAARGVRMVVSGMVPSPWSEAAKGLFHVQRVPVLAVRAAREDPEVAAFAKADNVPSVMYDDEPPRTDWAAIVMPAERLGAPGLLVPVDGERRVRMIGLIHEIAGEDGLGWSARLRMIDASHSSERAARAHGRMRAVLRTLSQALGDADYHGGQLPNALDVYSATFLTPLTTISEEDCPGMLPALRQAFAVPRDELGDEVPGVLLAHRERMFERHLAWPIAL